MSRKVAITGSGQLAWELSRTRPADTQLEVLSFEDLDIADTEAVMQTLAQLKPEVVINAAAYTAVDKAEQESEQAFAANARGPENLARACGEVGAYLLHISTDFVFDGRHNRPYSTEASKQPLSVYGRSKAAGEDAVMAANADFALIRTAWVYSSKGHNFVKTMLRLMAEKPQLGIVGDQLGTPTWAHGLAQVCWSAVDKGLAGIYHWTDAGVASWYDFAVAIQDLACERGLLDKCIPIASIATEDYPTPAQRPAFGVLDKAKTLAALPELRHRHWRHQLVAMLDELTKEQSPLA